MKKNTNDSYRNTHTGNAKKLDASKRTDGRWEMSANDALKVNYLTNGRYFRK